MKTLSRFFFLPLFVLGIGCDPSQFEGCAADAFEGCVVDCLSDCSLSDCESCASCGSCEGCESCTVTPHTFPLADRIDNAATVRLTPTGLDFLENNSDGLISAVLGAGGIQIPPIVQNISGIDVSVCGGNAQCFLNVALEDFNLEPVEGNPDLLQATVGVVAKSVNANGQPQNLPLNVSFMNNTLASCGIGVDLSGGNSPNVTAVAQIAIERQNGGARDGYSKLKIVDLTFASNAIELADIDLSSCGLNLQDPNLMAAINTLLGGLSNSINNILDQTITSFATICQPALPELGCPPGSTEGDDGFCYNNSNECVELLLGLEGRVNTGQLLSGVTPGISAIVDLLFAASGEALAVSNGYTINFYGGAKTVQTNDCVPEAAAPAIPTVPAAQAFQGGADADGDLIIGVSGDFIGYFLHNLWSAGALCLQVGTSLSDQLSTGLFGQFLPALAPVPFPIAKAPLALALNPGAPPVFALGEGTDSDRLLQITLPDLSIDFYVWMSERYVRTFRFTSDLGVSVNLNVDDDGGIALALGELRAQNATVSDFAALGSGTNATQLATTVSTVLGLAGGLIGGQVPAINIGDLLAGDPEAPSALPIPFGIGFGANAFQRVTEGDSNFLGIFAQLEPLPTAAFSVPTDTTVEITKLDIPDKNALKFDTFGQGERPRIELAMNATGPAGVDYEYSYRIDGHDWSAWSRSQYAIGEADSLLFQGEHKVYARARVVGEPSSIDHSAAQALFTIDTLEPTIALDTLPKGSELWAYDMGTAAENLEYRWRFADADWNDWTIMGSQSVLVTEAVGKVEFEVRDQAGNVASSVEGLRGVPPGGSDTAGSCNCRVASARPTMGELFALPMCLIVLGAVVWRRRRR
ncbi:MAG: hypothetical protein R3A47_09635 [Polyangiales bacterium]